ncbi:hypothetical protein E8E12_008335 [Didymella heteroderae]|uniref:RRM domain-containing protein n=1 Tax=Didymella heteroderae TaxID=1769908 RepID=A0A9P4WQZ7_9PLEO|nr:hypothetical protein E8E12_008335 [Didymella heteroderae]
MDRRRRASSATSKSLLSRQLASITDTLAKASQRCDEEVKRAYRSSRASTATTNPASPKKPTAPEQREDSGHGQPTPLTVCLRGGGGDEENRDPYRTPCLEQREKAEVIRQERTEFDKLVQGKGPDDSERKKMIAYLLAQSNLAEIIADKEVLRARLEAEEEKVDEDQRIVIREKEIDEFEELRLKEKENMEQEDYEERLRQREEGRREGLRVRAKVLARSTRSDFLIKTNYAALFRDPEEEKAELARLEEELFQHLVTQIEAQDAREEEAEQKRHRSEKADQEGYKRFKTGESPGDSAMALSLDEQEDEHAIPVIPQLRGSEENDHDADHHWSENATHQRMATSRETEKSQREVDGLAAAGVAENLEDSDDEERRSADTQRRSKIDGDFQEMISKTQALGLERRARLREAGGRVVRQEAAYSSGLSRDDEFDHMIAQMEAADYELVEALQRQGPSIQRTRAEKDATDISAAEEPSRRTADAHPEAECDYTPPPRNPPDHSPSSYAASEFEARGGNVSHFDALRRGGMRGGYATPLDDDPGALLAELSRLRESRHLREVEVNDAVHGGDESRQMLADFDGLSRPTRATATAYDDPRGMLEELLTLSAPGPRELRSPATDDFEDNDDDDINTLRARLERLRSSSDKSEPPILASTHSDEDRIETVDSADLSPEAIPYVIALVLEHSGCEWEVARGWTRCLFGSGLDSYEAQKEKEIAVARAEEALQKTIASVMEVKEENRRKDEETKLQRRLIVSNLAASADVEGIECQFSQYRYDIVEITMLPDRDPLKRTRTAHVDFASRKTAVQASYISGQVYGLIFDVKLAVPVEQASE